MGFAVESSSRDVCHTQMSGRCLHSNAPISWSAPCVYYLTSALLLSPRAFLLFFLFFLKMPIIPSYPWHFFSQPRHSCKNFLESSPPLQLATNPGIPARISCGALHVWVCACARPRNSLKNCLGSTLRLLYCPQPRVSLGSIPCLGLRVRSTQEFTEELPGEHSASSTTLLWFAAVSLLQKIHI